LRGMSAVAAGLITASGLKLISGLRNNRMGRTACMVFGVASFIAIALLRVPLGYVLPVAGILACIYAWRKVAP